MALERGRCIRVVDLLTSAADGLGWGTLSNGELPRAAEREGFEVLVTCDQNIKHQNSLYGQRRNCLEVGGQAAMTTGGCGSLAAWKRCPKPVPSGMRNVSLTS